MSEIYICTGCMQTIGQDEPTDYCRTCQSYKYFDWVEEDEDV